MEVDWGPKFLENMQSCLGVINMMHYMMILVAITMFPPTSVLGANFSSNPHLSMQTVVPNTFLSCRY